MIGAIVSQLWAAYRKNPARLKVIDAFLVYQFLTGVVQFIYCALVGTFPFNSFLSGFFACVGCFILTACLRIQVNPANASTFKISPERAYADYVFCNIVLFITVMNFMG
eukprot:TRINITY_DN2829_c3_g1_i1.p1 TRINITY_DN2829_c3_g1~~TRINITY_DN2829_c3_g1_i1.p1  ORF type:complete len:117 (-),score=13.18 TRINITY_DN2829_c3_g1_i1:919-1245(-)